MIHSGEHGNSQVGLMKVGGARTFLNGQEANEGSIKERDVLYGVTEAVFYM